MKDVRVRDIDDRALEVLKRLAEACGRSLVAELRRIIAQAARAADAARGQASAIVRPGAGDQGIALRWPVPGAGDPARRPGRDG
ncbi:MAG: hypothetical protein NVSMB9_31840 [Isosphaeraceae bacterium]